MLDSTMIMIKNIFSLFILPAIIIITSPEVKATSVAERDSLITGFFRELYSFSFHKADSVAASFNSSEIDPQTLYNLKANLAWWHLISGDDQQKSINSCENYIKQSLNEGLKRGDDVKQVYLGIVSAYSLKARLENYRGNSLKSMSGFYKSISYIRKLSDIDSHDEKILLALGLYYYFTGYFESRNVILNAITYPFLKGDTEKGLAYLQMCSQSKNEMIRTEASYFLLKIYTSTEKKYLTALSYALILTSAYPDNMIYQLEALRVLSGLERKSELAATGDLLRQRILNSKDLNSFQKNHLISQIDEISKK